jgi:hypothetical protein
MSNLEATFDVFLATLGHIVRQIYISKRLSYYCKKSISQIDMRGNINDAGD